jgi:hypothetical protein
MSWGHGSSGRVLGQHVQKHGPGFSPQNHKQMTKTAPINMVQQFHFWLCTEENWKCTMLKHLIYSIEKTIFKIVGCHKKQKYSEVNRQGKTYFCRRVQTRKSGRHAHQAEVHRGLIWDHAVPLRLWIGGLGLTVYIFGYLERGQVRRRFWEQRSFREATTGFGYQVPNQGI